VGLDVISLERRLHRIRVLAADPQPLYREAVARAIRRQPHFELVGELGDGREALEAIERLRPDVAVLDRRLPSLDGPRILNAVIRDELPTRIVFLSSTVKADAAYRAVADGAAGYLSKDADAEEILEAIRAAARGQTFLAPEIQTGIAAEIRLRAKEERPLLSPREREILRLIARGRSAPEIARDLHLAPATVKTHLLHIYDKLGVSERAAAVAEAMRRGLLE
jgi:two-component system nitrate/nitrite response regulator NarL